MNELQKGEILDWKSKPSSLWRLHAAPSRSKPLQAQATVSLAGEQLLIIITIVDDLSGRCVTSNKTKTVCKLQLHFTYIGKIVLKVV